MELKITKEKVLEAASKCSTAKATLETLFPECFEKGIGIIEPFEVDTFANNRLVFIGHGFVSEEHKGRVLMLNTDQHKWEIINDHKSGYIMLIPTKK